MSSTRSPDHTAVNAIYYWLGLTTLAIIGLFSMPIDKSSAHYYHLSTFGYRATVLTIDIPIFLVWLVAFWGYAKLQLYARSVARSEEGRYFSRLALGSTWLAWSLPLTFLVMFLAGVITTTHPQLHHSTVIIGNYLNLILTLVAFTIIGAAARHLSNISQKRLPLISSSLIMVLFSLIGAPYCYFILKALNLHSLSSSQNPYFLPSWLMIISVIIPFLYAWFIGLLAAYQIAIVALHTEGILYRRALLFLVGGIVAVVLSSLFASYASSVWPLPAHLNSSPRLVITVLLRFTEGIGFVLLAIGAHKLKKIEDV